MRIVLFLVAFGATMTLTTVSLAKTVAPKREIASEALSCSTAISNGSVEYEVPKCRSDRAVVVYPYSQGYSKLCCVRN